MSDDEISDNDGSTKGTGHYDHGSTTCGCGGGGKFWEVTNAVVETDYVHNNGDPGIWVDTDNAGFLISHNYIADNFSVGIQYEISYNATISDNTLVGNSIGTGQANAGFPTGAIYISNSGGSSAVPSHYRGELEISHNIFTDNWGGVALYTNSDRYCGDGYDDACTLVTTSTYTISSCSAHLKGSKATQTPDYYDNCRWKTKTVTVEANSFNFTASAVSPKCSVANTCGFNGDFSMWGTTTPWEAWAVPLQMAHRQHNVFKDNTYTGNWHFDAFAQGVVSTWAQWTKGTVTVTGHRAVWPRTPVRRTMGQQPPCHVYNIRHHAAGDHNRRTTPPGTTHHCDTVPSAPTNLHETAKSDDSVSLAWTAPASTGGTAITHYRVYKTGALFATLGSATLTATVTGPVSSSTYRFLVNAENAVGTSQDSDAVVVTTDKSAASAPSVPRNLHDTGREATAVTLAWTAPTSDGGSAITHYLVYRSGTLVSTVKSGRTDRITGLSASTAYVLTVKAENAIGVSVDSNALEVTTATTA